MTTPEDLTAFKKYWEEKYPELTTVGLEPWQIFQSGWTQGIDHYARLTRTAKGRRHIVTNLFHTIYAAAGLVDWMVEELEEFIDLDDNDEPKDPNGEEVVLYDAISHLINYDNMRIIKKYVEEER